MRFGILGQLEVHDSADGVQVAQGRQRLLLAVLLAHANEPVAKERLVDALWGERAPPTATRSLHNHVSALRKALADGRLGTEARGYRLVVAGDELDAARFDTLVSRGRDALAAGHPEPAAELLHEALALWRGPAFGDLANEAAIVDEAARLDERRIAAVEDRIDADLALGRHTQLVAELDMLVAQHPLRERLRGQQMLALYRSGRQADALAAYAAARRHLVEELGLEPGPALRDLERAVLEQDPALIDAPRSPVSAMIAPRVPALPNRTIGRERELDGIARLLRSGERQLLTLIGPGGVGKTRLALEAARGVGSDFADGARFVSLAAVQRAGDVPAAILQQLATVTVAGELPERAVERYLAAKRLLLVIDNCEHVLGAAPFVATLLAACPGVRVLATSREPLAVQSEQCYSVPPLAATDAVTLFAERARARDPEVELGDGDAVAEICRRVDGLPLAIELAAARCGLLSPAEIADRLDTAVGTPGPGVGDAPARQRTLRATIEWSHALLDADEQAAFARLAVFAGGATLDAVEAITGAGIAMLDRLVAKSLLMRTAQADGRTRLTMLETVRAYAAERFGDAPDSHEVRERHFRHYLALAERHGTERALWGAQRGGHLAALDADVENLHAALHWAVVDQRDGERALSLCEALGPYWLMRDRYTDAVRWIDETLHLPGADRQPELRVRVLCTKVWALFPLGRARERPPILDEAEAIARQLPDLTFAAEVAFIRASIEMADNGRGDVANALADDAVRIAEAAGEDWAIAMATFVKTIPPADPAELRERVERAASLLEETGIVYQLAYLLSGAAYAALCAGSDAYAAELVRRAIPAIRDLDSPYLWAHVRGNAGLTALFRGEIDDAREALRDHLALCRELVVLPFASEGLAGLAAVAAIGDDLDRAARLAGAAAAHRYGIPDDEVDARLRETFLEPARARHGAHAWDAAEREGAALSFDDAIAYALTEPSAVRPAVEQAGSG